jgi:hypothetical protein
MIISAEMEHTMDQQRQDFFLQRPMGGLGLPPGGWQRNDDITEVSSVLMEAVGGPGLPERKGQYIGAAILAPIPPIQPPHPQIAHEGNAHVGGRFPDGLEHGLGQAQHPLWT